MEEEPAKQLVFRLLDTVQFQSNLTAKDVWIRSQKRDPETDMERAALDIAHRNAAQVRVGRSGCILGGLSIGECLRACMRVRACLSYTHTRSHAFVRAHTDAHTLTHTHARTSQARIKAAQVGKQKEDAKKARYQVCRSCCARRAASSQRTRVLAK